jgi:dihydroxyacetone kinase-like protein
MIDVIHENRAYLSEIDGAIGDGDHGINMDKGFTMCGTAIADEETSMSDALRSLGRTLLDEIGGSMGPLYGSMFRRMARASRNAETIDTTVLATMLEEALAAIGELGSAQVGDKTMIDTLAPAAEAARAASDRGDDLCAAVSAVTAAAEKGWSSTRDLVAKVGRAARLGERSRGVLDAGATSCYLLLKAMGEAMCELAREAT